MMIDYEPMRFLPTEIQQKWMARLQQATPTENGAFHLVNIRTTQSRTFEEQRVIVLVIDENGFPIPNIPVAFAYSSSTHQIILTPDFLWSPPAQKAFVVPTQGGGQIDMVQGSPVNEGEPGGITVYILEPEYSSDYVTGAGMLADHTGLHLTFQLRRNGVRPLLNRLADIEARLDALEAK